MLLVGIPAGALAPGGDAASALTRPAAPTRSRHRAQAAGTTSTRLYSRAAEALQDGMATAAGAVRAVAASVPTAAELRARRLAQAEAEPDPRVRAATLMLLSLPYDAEADGWALQVGDHPEAPGHWGVTDPYRHELYIGDGAFASPERLFMVVAHEAAHARHFSHPELAAVIAQMPAGREQYADCQAIVWGADAALTYYWSCPAPYRDVVAGASGVPG